MVFPHQVLQEERYEKELFRLEQHGAYNSQKIGMTYLEGDRGMVPIVSSQIFRSTHFPCLKRRETMMKRES